MSNTKLSPHTTWLFAAASVLAGIGISFAVAGFGQKVAAAAYFAIVAIGGFASTFLTRARIRTAVLAFLTIGALAAVAYFFLVDAIFRTTTVAMTDAVSGGAAHAQGVEMGGFFGRFFGIIVAVVVFLETIVAGIGGAVAGAKSRGQDGIGALGAMAKSAR
jgi:hypothetical protein